MKTNIYKKITAAVVACGLVIGNVSGLAQEAGLKLFNDNSIVAEAATPSINATEVTLYYLNDYYKDFLTLHSSYNTSYQLKVTNATMLEPVALTLNKTGNAGSLFGEYFNSGTLEVKNVTSHGRYSLIRSSGTNGNAGGLLGKAYYGGYTISDCSASSYVYADNGKCAGGFIADFKPQATTTITNCFAGGHLNSNREYIDDLALDDDKLSISKTKEGGYNVYGGVAVGGFIGFIGTDGISATFTNCFTTASVNSPSANGADSDVSKRAVGGFAGRMHAKGQTYNNCYVEGLVYKKADLTGYFIGHNDERGSIIVPSFSGDLVMRGINFNDDQSINLINFDDVNGIGFADYNLDNIINLGHIYVPN